ncbi:ubiquitin carboxyl-terminal hydrolase [Nitzschia inconspicua]|uniref:ubiquitinyl hydrolase 1 n=1 Tax=Nitzschia inconspicua TaxID=303405 RepID=A0A9K3LZ70_9STRA|nr:ubiquitin carboxyl-terminal hydrolase [Nitzschia inconspicua]
MTKLKSSKKDKHAEKTRLDFDSFETYLGSTIVGRRNLEHTTTVAASAKELYIDQRMVKWENVLSMTLYPSCNNENSNDEDGNGDGDYHMSREPLEYCLEVTCREQKQDKENYVASEDYKGQVRTYRVIKLVYGNQKRSWIPQWNRFQSALQELYDKELMKRDRRKEREQEEKRQLANSRSFGNTNRSYGRRSTYSKREAFLSKNRKNIESNRTLPDTDEEDDDFWETYRKGNETAQETMRRLQGRDDVFASVEKKERMEQSEFVYHHDDDGEEEEEETEWTGAATSPATNDSDSAPALSSEDDPMELDTPLGQSGNTDEEEKKTNDREEKAENKITRTKRLRHPGLKGKKVKASTLDDSDDDEDFFGSSQTFTTPATQRLVSPGTLGVRKRKHVLQDDSDEEVDQRVVLRNSTFTKPEQEEDNESKEEEDPAKGMTKITSFFSKGADATAAAKKLLVAPKPSIQRREKSAASPRENDKDSIQKQPVKTKAIIPPSKFFAPRKSVNTAATKLVAKSNKDSGDIINSSTLGDTHTPTSRRHATDIENEYAKEAEVPLSKEKLSLKSSATPSRHADGARRKSIEDEDPIEEVDSSQSPPGLHRKRLKQCSRLFTKKQQQNSIAFRALDMADQSTLSNVHERVPVAQIRPSVCYSDRLKDRKRASPSHQSPSPSHRAPALKLNFDAIADDQQPPTERWRGLYNDGNTCYINSSLQALFSVRPFMEALSNKKEGHPLVHNLVLLWKRLQNKKHPASASARDFKAEIDKLTDQFEGFEQRDAHEFLNEVMDRVHEDLKPKASESRDGSAPNPDSKQCNDPIDDFFRLDVRVCLTCQSCGYFRTKDEMYKNLSLDITRPAAHDSESGFAQASVESCLSSFFQPELREINCEKCAEGRFATQQMKILSKPKALLLHLKRFIVEERPVNDENDPNGSTTELVFRKKKTAVELNTKVSLDAFLDSTIKATNSGHASSCSEYSIQSLVHHIGNTASSGHYTADALRNNNTWVSFDDGLTLETSLESIVTSPNKQRSVYMIMYSLE